MPFVPFLVVLQVQAIQDPGFWDNSFFTMFHLAVSLSSFLGPEQNSNCPNAFSFPNWFGLPVQSPLSVPDHNATDQTFSRFGGWGKPHPSKDSTTCSLGNKIPGLCQILDVVILSRERCAIIQNCIMQWICTRVLGTPWKERGWFSRPSSMWIFHTGWIVKAGQSPCPRKQTYQCLCQHVKVCLGSLQGVETIRFSQ